MDTDLSSVLKINGHAETIQKVFDVVKKTAYGAEFIIWGLENQDNVHYAMPLRHMLNIPDNLKAIVADYKMNLVQVKKSDNLHFHNQDISTVFDMIRFIYNEDYSKLNELYQDKPIDTELALVIGSITKSQKIIDQALKSEKEGTQMQMCKALQKLEQRGIESGRTEGIASGKKELLRQQVQKKLAKGKSLEIIADELEENESQIQSVIDELVAEKEK